MISNLVTVSFDFYLAFTAPDEGEFCLTEILGNKIITLLSCPISLAIGFLFYSTLLILIYTKIWLHLATVCPSGPCIELPDLVLVQGRLRAFSKERLATCTRSHNRRNWRQRPYRDTVTILLLVYFSTKKLRGITRREITTHWGTTLQP